MFITKLLCKYFGNWWTERMQKDSFLDQGKTETITYRIVKKLKFYIVDENQCEISILSLL